MVLVLYLVLDVHVLSTVNFGKIKDVLLFPWFHVRYLRIFLEHYDLANSQYFLALVNNSCSVLIGCIFVQDRDSHQLYESFRTHLVT